MLDSGVLGFDLVSMRSDIPRPSALRLSLPVLPLSTTICRLHNYVGSTQRRDPLRSCVIPPTYQAVWQSLQRPTKGLLAIRMAI